MIINRAKEGFSHMGFVGKIGEGMTKCRRIEEDG